MPRPLEAQGHGRDARKAQGASREPDFIGEEKHHQFSEAEGHDGEIVSGKPKRRRPAQHAAQRAQGHRSGHDDPEAQPVIERQDARRVGSDAVEAHIAQIQEVAEAGQNVQAHGQPRRTP